MEWIWLALLLIAIAVVVWFLLRRPSGGGAASSDDASASTTTDAAQPTPGAGEARVPGMTAGQTGHGAPGAGTAGVVGAGAGDSSAGHGSPGAGTADIPQSEGYGAPGPGTADVAGAGSAGPDDSGAMGGGYGAADQPFDQEAGGTAYGTPAQGDDVAYGDTDEATPAAQAVQPADTGEHWAPPGADVGDSRPGAPASGEPLVTDTEQRYGTGATEGSTTEAEDYPVSTEPADGSYEVPVDEGADTTADEQRWQETHAGGTWTTEDTASDRDWAAAEQPATGDAATASSAGAAPEQGSWTTGATDAHAHPADDTMASGVSEPVDDGTPYPGPMDDTAGTGTLGDDTAGGAGAVDDQSAQEAGDYGYDEAHTGATSAAGFAPGVYGPGSATPAEDGSGPSGWAVKGNTGSMLFHTPDSPSYESTQADVWFESEEAGRAAGFAHWDRSRR